MTRMDMPTDDTPLRDRVRGFCPQHLLGNHNETHQLAGYLRSADADSGALTKLFGHAARGQIDLTRLSEWHDALAQEMTRRGYTHDSPLAYDLRVPIGRGSITGSATNKISVRCGDCEV